MQIPPLTNPSHEITYEDKFFAHISNDSSMITSDLAGYWVEEFCKYLLRLEKNTNNRIVNKTVHEILAPLKAQLSLIEKTAKAQSLDESLDIIIGALNNKANQAKKNKSKRLTERLAIITGALNNKASKANEEPITFASGWRGTDEYAGHSIIAQLQYDKDGNLDLIMHNSGAGLNFHTQKPGWKGTLSATELVYKIPQKKLTQANINLLLKSLIEPGYFPIVENGMDIDSTQIFYLQLTNTMHVLNAKKQNPENYKTSYSVGQRGGTCAWKSLMAFIKNSIHDDRRYLLVKYEIKLDALLQYYQQQKVNGRLEKVPLVREQINFACENLARIIKKLDKADKDGSQPSIFDKEIRQFGLDTIWKIRAEVSSKPINVTKDENLAFSAILDNKTITFPNNNVMGNEFKKNQSSIEEKPSDPEKINYPEFNADNISESIDAIYQFGLNDKIDTLERLLVIEQIINSIKFPLDDILFQHLNPNQTTKLAGKLGDLAHLHMYLCGMQGSECLRYDSMLASGTLNIMLLKLSKDLLNPEIFKGVEAKKAACKFIKPLFSQTGYLSSKSVITDNPEFNSRCKYITQTSEALLKPFSDLTADVESYGSKDNLKDLFSLFPKSSNENSNNSIMNQEHAQQIYLALEQANCIVNTFINGSKVDCFSQEHGHHLDRNKTISIIDNEMSTKLYMIYSSNGITTERDHHHNSYTQTYLQSNIIAENNPEGVVGFNKGAFYSNKDDYRSQYYKPCSIHADKISFYISQEVIDVYGFSVQGLYNPATTINKLALQNRYCLDEFKFLQDLSSVYLAGDSTISFIYELISRYPEKLAYPGMQDVIFARLFLSNSIDEQIARAPEGILDLVQLLQKNLSKQTEDSLDPSTIFLLKISTQLENYISKLDTTVLQNKIFKESLKILSTISGKVAVALKKDPQNIKLRMLHIRTIKEITKDNIAEVLTSQILLNTSHDIVGGQPRVPFIEKTVALDLLLKNKDVIERLLKVEQETKNILSVVFNVACGIKDKISSIKGTYPSFTCTFDNQQSYTINIKNGQILYGKDTIRDTPPSFSSTEIYKSYFDNKMFSGQLSADQIKFSFTDEEKCQYIIQKHGQNHIILRSFAWPSADSAYQLLYGTKKIKHPLYTQIPSTLIDQNHDIWLSANHIIITDKKTKRVLYHISGSKIETADNQQTLSNLFADSNNDLTKKLLSFEDKSFIEVWQSKIAAAQLKIKLPRYNIEFTSDDAGKTLIWKQDHRYKIDMQPLKGLMHGFENYLILTPVDQNSGLNNIVLTPQQDIILNIATQKRQLDTNCDLQLRQQIKKEKVKNGDKYLSGVVTAQALINELRADVSQFNYQDSEHFTKCELDKEGKKLQPRSCAEHLHLAYIYLSVNRIPESLELLRQAFPIFTGSQDEMLWLSKIIAMQPSFVALTMKEKNLEEKITFVSSAELAAAKVFASFMLATKPEAIVKLTDNMQSDIATNLTDCIDKYYNTLNNVPNVMCLSKTQEMLLLQEFGGHYQRLIQLRSELEISAEKQIEPQKDSSTVYIKKIVLDLKEYNTNNILYNFLSLASQTAEDDKNHKHKYELKNIQASSDYKTLLLNFPAAIDILMNSNHEKRDNLIENIDVLLRIFNEPIGNIYQLTQKLSISDIESIKGMLVILKYVAVYPTAITADDTRNIHNLQETNHQIYRKYFELAQDKYFSESSPYSKLTIEFESPIATIEQIEFPNKPVLPASKLENPSLEKNKDVISKFLSTMCNNVNLTLTPMATSAELISEHDTESGYLSILQNEFDEDCKIGANKNKTINDTKAKNAQALNKDIVVKIKNKTETDILTSQNEETKEKTAIMDLANKIPKEKEKQAQLELSGRLQHKLTLPEILRLFLQQDQTQYEQQTFLNKDEIKELQQKVFDYLLNATKLQLLYKIQAVTTEIQGISAPDKKEEKLKELESLLRSKREYDPAANPAMLLFEYLDNKLIRADQAKYLSELLQKDNNGNYANTLCQMIMGGGKSKVLLPILAQQKASSDRLSIVVVSKDIYQTNLCDLTKTSAELFGQKTYELLFSRDTDIGNNYFENLYFKLKSCIKDHDYIITTPESIQSLELKYLELLKFKPKHEGIQYLEKTLKIIKTKGDAIIDEADQNLQTKKELNYAIGIKESIIINHPNLVQDVIAFYGFLERSCGVAEYISGIKALVDDKQKKDFIQSATKNLLIDKTSILHTILAANQPTIVLQESNQEALKKYLTNKDTPIPSFLEKCTTETKNRIAVLRENLSGLLEQTLSKHKNENYGLRSTPGDPIRSNIAVPYIGAQTPSKNSEFASILEQINYTMQTHIGQPIDKAIFTLIIKAFKERYIFAVDSFVDVQALQTEFESATGLKVKLQNIDLNDDIKITEVYEIVKNNLAIKQHALANFILPGIGSNPLQEKSNSQDFIRTFNSVQGFTGTPYNHRTVEPFLHYKANLSAGADGQTVDNIKNKTKNVVKSSADNLMTLFSSITTDKNKIRALIDQGAHCKNMSNETVAKHLRDIYKESHLTHILYFNTGNMLTALPIDDKLPTIVLSSTDPKVIQDTINATPEQCFTYYDQRHATGIDIKQADNAQALVTISETTILRDLLQATMRMRGLAAGQALQFVVPPQIAENIKNAEDIIKFTFDNQVVQLADDHYAAAKQQITSIIRTDLLQHLLDAPEDKKALYIEKFASIFFTENKTSLFDQYGNALNKINTDYALQNFVKSQVKVWEEALMSLNLANPTSKVQIESKLNAVCHVAAPVCKKEIFDGQDVANSAEQEQEQEQQQQKETQKEQQLDSSYEKREPLNRVEITSNLANLLNGPATTDSQFITLNKAIESSKLIPWLFDENIFISLNMSNVFKEQKDIFAAKKEVYDVMIIYDTKNQSSKYVLLTPEDAEEVKNYCLDEKNQAMSQHIIIQSIHGHTNFNSNHGDLTKPLCHKRVMQQIAFYNGDADLLVSNHDWLLEDKEQLENKMKLFDQIILSHPIKRPSLANLKKALEKANVANNINNTSSIKDISSLEPVKLPQINSVATVTFNHINFDLLQETINHDSKPKATTYPKIQIPNNKNKTAKNIQVIQENTQNIQPQDLGSKQASIRSNNDNKSIEINFHSAINDGLEKLQTTANYLFSEVKEIAENGNGNKENTKLKAGVTAPVKPTFTISAASSESAVAVALEIIKTHDESIYIEFKNPTQLEINEYAKSCKNIDIVILKKFFRTGLQSDTVTKNTPPKNS